MVFQLISKLSLTESLIFFGGSFHIYTFNLEKILVFEITVSNLLTLVDIAMSVNATSSAVEVYYFGLTFIQLLSHDELIQVPYS